MEDKKNQRPQEPHKPYSYYEEEISYTNTTDQIVLSGTLTLPDKAGVFPAVVLIAGYGPYDRDASGMGHKYFLVLADYLTRQGIAVLRFDKRGVGKSTGDWSTVTSEELAHDVIAGVAYLKTRSEIDSDSIGLIGLSEGGLIAAMVAAQSADVSYAVLMAPALAMKIDDMLYHTALQLRADGASEEFIERDQIVRKMVYEVAQQETHRDAAQAMMRVIIGDYLKTLPESHKLEAASLPFAFTEAKVEGLVKVLTSPAYQFFLRYDPAEMLERIDVPLLTIVGDHDYITSIARIAPVIGRACSNSGNHDCAVIKLHGLNHMLQTCATGSLMEYGTIEETMSPGALKVISDWILDHTQK